MIKRFGLAILGGVVGMALMLAAAHLWQDHQTYHALLEWTNGHAAWHAKAAPPAAPK